jgi:hypothetical protein
MRADGSLGFKRVVVAGAVVDGPRIFDVDLAGGRDTLLVIPDEDGTGEGDWASRGGRTDFARVELPVTSFPYRYRLAASIVPAEAARQIGRPAVVGRPAPRRGLTYESALEVAAGGEERSSGRLSSAPIDAGAAGDARFLAGFYALHPLGTSVRA